MGLKDFIVTPLVIFLILIFSILIKWRLTNPQTARYFIPALTIKMFSAIALGLIYQYYYLGGDTFGYYEQGTLILEAFKESKVAGFKLLLSFGNFDGETHKYYSLLKWYKFPAEFLVVKITAFLGLFTFNTYSAIAVIFATYSFFGSWALYLTFLKIYPQYHKIFAITIFFIPSVFFWGSGLLKDSLMIGSIGFLFYAFYNIFILKSKILSSIIFSCICLYILYTIRIYLLLAFLPPAMFWIIVENNLRIKNKLIRKLSAPLFMVIALLLITFLVTNITKGNQKYDLQNIAARTKINADYLYHKSIVEKGSAYYLGKMDGTFGSILRLSPLALNVTLFRPYIWEVKNPFMLLSAFEALGITILTLFVILKSGIIALIKRLFSNPFVTFCLIFSLVLAIAVGLNSFNFGTLVRYKIPILPFYISALLILYNKIKEEKQKKRKSIGPRYYR